MRHRLPGLWICTVAHLALLLSSDRAAGHNGSAAIAYPVSGIAVDGDLSDWPREAKLYPILLTEYGVEPRDEVDLRAAFRIGYEEEGNAVYIGIEVFDESTVIDTSVSASWDTQDGCEVYLAPGHEIPPSQYMISGESVSTREDGGARFDPAGESVERAFVRDGASHRYEWRLPAGEQARLSANVTVGVDVVVMDKDEDGSFTWMAWGPGVSKFNAADRAGDVVLMDRPTGEGRVRGVIHWEDNSSAASLARVRIQSISSAGCASTCGRTRWVVTRERCLREATGSTPSTAAAGPTRSRSRCGEEGVGGAR